MGAAARLAPSAPSVGSVDEAGVDAVDAAVDALSGLTSQPCLGSLVAALAQTAALMNEGDSHIYRIADYYGVTSSFADLLANAQEASRDGAPASTTDPRIRPMFVGSKEWQAQARAAFGKNPFGSVPIPIFGSVDDAIVYARQELAKED